MYNEVGEADPVQNIELLYQIMLRYYYTTAAAATKCVKDREKRAGWRGVAYELFDDS